MELTGQGGLTGQSTKALPIGEEKKICLTHLKQMRVEHLFMLFSGVCLHSFGGYVIICVFDRQK